VKGPCIESAGHAVGQRWSICGLCLSGILALIVAVGVLLRIAQWAHNREFWHDEAYLALDLIAKSYSQLTGPLTANMSYPIAFLLTTKFVISRLGASEYAFRLLPLVAGIASIPLFMELSRRIAQPGEEQSQRRSRVMMVLIATTLFAMSKHHIYYSSELRHYALDVFAACALYLIALPRPHQSASPWRPVLLGLLGALLIWYSIAAVFVLAAIAGVDLVSHGVAREWRRTMWLAVWCVPWGLSFLAHFYMFKHNIALRPIGPELDAICAYLSVPIPPTSAADLRTWREAFEHIFSFPGGFTYLGLAGFAFLAGCISLLGNRKPLLLKLLLPFVFAMLASSFHQYPFRNQYILFLLPSLYLILSEGVSAFFGLKTRQWHVMGIVMAVMLLAQPTGHSLRVLGQPRSGPGGGSVIKPLLAHVKESWHEGDVLYVTGPQEITFGYYGPLFGFTFATPARDLGPTVPEKQAFVLTQSASPSAAQDPERFWLLYQGHERLLSGGHPADMFREVEARQSESSSLYLYAVRRSRDSNPF